jgi:hypothetical protein
LPVSRRQLAARVRKEILRWGSGREKASRLVTYPLEKGCAEKIDIANFHGEKCETAGRAQTIRWFMGKKSET